ncbi:DUF2267 domain-containing protein [Streptomyces bungoensis]|uniref:DUF2267 domain-containing protein n=1 Tax=Streptomyces bungoensis TaxID=285568 RepID=UPI003439550D
MTVTTPTPQPRTTIPAPAQPLRPRVHEDTPGDADWLELVEAVREAGQYPTGAEAEHVTRTVLAALGGHVTGEERVALAQGLPHEAGKVIAAQIPATQPLTAREFVESVATRVEGSTPATARWDVSSVLGVLAAEVGEQLTTRILAQLPPGYALLFGRAELAATTA